jgi:membrane complex biogenesis BtpA family protein
VKLLFNIVPEGAAYLSQRDVVSIAKSTVFNARPDALCVSGLTAGAETDAQTLSLVKQAVPGTLVFANTGVRPENVEQQLSIADGAVVGTTFKVDGKFENPVDVKRVKSFMEKVRQFRANLGV